MNLPPLYPGGTHLPPAALPLSLKKEEGWTVYLGSSVWPLRGSTVDSLFTCVPSTGNSKGRGGSTDLCLMELMVEGERETSNKKT